MYSDLVLLWLWHFLSNPNHQTTLLILTLTKKLTIANQRDTTQLPLDIHQTIVFLEQWAVPPALKAKSRLHWGWWVVQVFVHKPQIWTNIVTKVIGIHQQYIMDISVQNVLATHPLGSFTLGQICRQTRQLLAENNMNPKNTDFSNSHAYCSD